jgi:hypothetical protein
MVGLNAAEVTRRGELMWLFSIYSIEENSDL